MKRSSMKKKRLPADSFDNHNETENRPSRSAKKRESTALQKLGEELAGLSPAARKEMNLPPTLEEALALHDKIRDREGARRQRQYIGRLMRETDATGIADALARRRSARAANVAAFHRAEQWRDRLLGATGGELENQFAKLAQSASQQPDSVAMRNIRELVEDVRQTGPGNAPASTRASRELFRQLSRLLT